MTVIPFVTRAVTADETPDHPRVIGVGLRDGDHDRAAIDWAVAVARPQDAVHVVHAYVPPGAGDLAQPPDARAGDRQRLSAERLVGRAVQRAAAALPAELVDGCAIAGPPDDVLIELSGAVDLLVLGEDRDANASVEAHVHANSRCPVVSVPSAYRGDGDARPITVVGDDRGFPASTLGFAAQMAQGRGVALQLARIWSAEHDGAVTAAWLAERQEEMSASLADLQKHYPGLPLVARLELVAGWIALARAHSSLVVVSPRRAGAVRARVSHRGQCPVAVVPDEPETPEVPTGTV